MNITKDQLVKFAVAISNAIERMKPWCPHLMTSFVINRLDFESDDLAGQVENIVDQLKRDYPILSKA